MKQKHLELYNMIKTGLIGLGAIIGFVIALVLTFWTLGVIYIAINNLFFWIHGYYMGYCIDNVNHSGIQMIKIMVISAVVLFFGYLVGTIL